MRRNLTMALISMTFLTVTSVVAWLLSHSNLTFGLALGTGAGILVLGVVALLYASKSSVAKVV